MLSAYLIVLAVLALAGGYILFMARMLTNVERRDLAALGQGHSSNKTS